MNVFLFFVALFVLVIIATILIIGKSTTQCCSCYKYVPSSQIHYTHRNEEDLPLCDECWKAALLVQDAIRPENFAEAARERWLQKFPGIIYKR